MVTFVAGVSSIIASSKTIEYKRDSGNQPAIVANEYKFLRNYMALNDDERTIIGQDFDSFIKECSFRGKDCRNKT